VEDKEVTLPSIITRIVFCTIKTTFGLSVIRSFDVALDIYIVCTGRRRSSWYIPWGRGRRGPGTSRTTTPTNRSEL
jgi:hypothetical protein